MEGADDDGAHSEAPSDWSDLYDEDDKAAGLFGRDPAATEPELSLPSVDQPEPEAPVAEPPTTLQDGADTLLSIAAQSVDTGDVDHDDSSSEMDLSDLSRPATPEPLPLPAIATANSDDTADAIAESSNHTGAKRKLSDAVEHADLGVEAETADEQSKKRKLSDPPRHVPLPTAVWQRIFMYCSPASLCRLLRVSKELNHILTGVRATPALPQDKSAARTVDSETIWTHSRKLFFPLLPRPLSRYSELEMLQLLGGKTCQFCGRDPVPPPATTVFNCGPGHHGVRVIYPFGLRTCGGCIEPQLKRDVELLSDPSVAPLRLGLPYAFRSLDFHFASEFLRQQPGGIPGNLRFSKVHYGPDLQALQAEEEHARSLGEGAADEWRKGLFTKGKDVMADSARWEKWEMQLPLGANLSQVLREYDPSSFPRSHSVQNSQSRPAGVNGTPSSATTNGTHPLPQPVHVFQNGYQNGHQNGYGPPFGQFPQSQFHALPYPPPATQPPPFRYVKNAHEVELARQARKAEIERRCRELEPPVEPNVLQHMESFQAAMQITTPLTDAAWEMLKPRILAQRESAEIAEHHRATMQAALQAAVPMPISEDIISKPAKETYDREYQDSQIPLRTKLGEYADDIINGQWKGGKMVERDNIPIFAVQVLLHVKQRYDEDKKHGTLPEYELPTTKAARNDGTPCEPPYLSLDNMKWVYENKVRPVTDNQRKEHFICAGCEDKKPKWFAFEGLIQHYGAKHTAAFSKGNIVVHWETAKWPEQPPFNANPSHWIVKADRRPSDFRQQGRARNAPQSHDTPFRGPGGGPIATGYSNGYQQQIPGYPPAPYGQAYSLGQPIGDFQEQPEKPSINVSRVEQLNKLSSDAREIWDSLQDVQDLMECIKIQTVIHNAVFRFKQAFHAPPVLDLFTEALATCDEVRPLKNVSGLACKSCVGASPNAAQSSYWGRIRGLKLYNTSTLITHFKLMHQHENHMGKLDWARDMIEVPENQIVKDVMRTPGMNDEKLGLIAAAFPTAFPSPLPKIGVVTEEAVASAPAKGLLGRLAKKQQKQKKKGQKRANGGQEHESSQEPLPEPKDDEYNPLRPALIQSEVPDPAQFDTDARRPTVQTAPQAQSPAAGTFNLAPETLAALQSLSSVTSNFKAPTIVDRVSRSPSVGRAEPASSSSRPSVSASVATPTGPPDIAAILASLTSNTAATASQPAISNRPVSSSRQAHPDGCEKSHHEPTPLYQIEARQPSTRYDSTYRSPQQPAPAASHDIGELQAALMKNSRQYEQNQHQHQTYREPVRAAHAPAPAHSPPQYQYVYEDRHAYSQQPTHAPIYREAPVQYIQVPEREYVPQGYQYEYERPVSKPIYVDQYGRPLIPIDSAPAPVQYAPNPYEQPQYARVPEQHVYTTMAQPAHHQAVYDDRRPVYYEQVAQPTRYATYDDGRASVPRS